MANFPLIVCFFSLLAVGLSIPLGCPNIEDLSPCSCKRLAFGLHVVCANFNTSNHLTKAFRILRDYRVHTVLLHALYIEDTLPSDLFDGLQIKEIRVEKSKLRFSEPAFSGLDASLYVLNVAQQSLIKSKEKLARFSLAKLTKLNELTVQWNHLENVRDNWLNEKVPNVNTIILDSNDITYMEDHVFANLASLKKISLADNRIKDIKRTMFPRPAAQLTRIDLSYNEIHSLPADFFFDMPSLKEIILSGNEIKSLPETTWSPVWEQLTQVLLFENQLECGDNIEWIKEYKKPYQLDGNCVLPKRMSGRSIREFYKT